MLLCHIADSENIEYLEAKILSTNITETFLLPLQWHMSLDIMLNKLYL